MTEATYEQQQPLDHATRNTLHVLRFTFYAFVLSLSLLRLPSPARAQGPIEFIEGWHDGVTDTTYSVAWGDVDGDGDLDLAVGNDGVNRVYENVGGGGFAEITTLGSATDSTKSVAWEDMGGIRLYENTRQGGRVLPDNAPFLGTTGPLASSANFYALPVILDSPTIPIPYTLLSGGRSGGQHWGLLLSRRQREVATGDTVTTNLATGRRLWRSRADGDV